MNASNYKIRQKALLSANLPLTSGTALKMGKSQIRSFSGQVNLTREKIRVYIPDFDTYQRVKGSETA